MRNILIPIWLGIGGIAGTLSRYYLTIIFESGKIGDFPLGTLIVNLTGCYILGFTSELAGSSTLISPEVKLAITTGFAGAFTTFSTLIYENYHLAKDTQFVLSIMYTVLSVAGGAALLYFGILTARLIIRQG